MLSKPCTYPGRATPTPSPNPLPEASEHELTFSDPPSTSRLFPAMDKIQDLPPHPPEAPALSHQDDTHVYSSSTLAGPDATPSTSPKQVLVWVCGLFTTFVCFTTLFLAAITLIPKIYGLLQWSIVNEMASRCYGFLSLALIQELLNLGTFESESSS